VTANHRLIVSAVIGATCVLATSEGTAATFFDGDFLSGWRDSVILSDDPVAPGTGPGTATASISRVSTGGNPGAFRESTHNIVYGDGISTVGLNDNAVYDPSVSGAIETIDLQIDLRQSVAGGATGISLVLEQDGLLYFSLVKGFSSTSFVTFADIGLTASDFDTNLNAGIPGATPSGLVPDFSATGSPITLGYAVGNGLSGPGTLTNVIGADNWTVIITPVPEPGTFSLMALGLAGLGLYTRKRTGS